MSISIITATFNSADTIKSTLFSLNSQTYSDYEHLVIDGASNDDTLSVVNEVARVAPRIISERDHGIFDALNKGITASSGDYIGFLHSDDMYANSNVLQTVSDYINEYKPDILYGNLQYVSGSESRKVVRNWRAGNFSISKLKYGWMPLHPTFFMKKSLYSELGNFNTKFNISADYDSILRYMSNPTRQVGYIDQVLVHMKVGGNSNKLTNILPKMKEDYKILSENGYNPFVGLLGKNVRKLHQIRLSKNS